MQRLAPPNVEAQAEYAGKISFAFGRRFFLLLFIGLAWIAPAWKEPRFLLAMVLWDLMTLAFWVFDLSRMPRPEEITVRRVWHESLGLAQVSRITIEIKNSSRVSATFQVTDESPATFRPEIPGISIAAPSGNSAGASYTIEPTVRGDANFGDVWLRYSSPLLLAERWADVSAGIAALEPLIEADDRPLTSYTPRKTDR